MMHGTSHRPVALLRPEVHLILQWASNIVFFIYNQYTCDLNYRRKAQKALVPGILDSQEIKGDSNSKILNFDVGLTMQLQNMFRKFEKISIRWIALTGFCTMHHCNLNTEVAKISHGYTLF